MSQKENQKENSEKAVLTQIQNRAIIISPQGEVKSQLEVTIEDRVSSQVRDSQASSCAASHGPVLTQAQLASQHSVSSQATVASQAQPRTQASQHVSSQDSVKTQAQSVSSQPTVPTLSQKSSQGAVSSQKRKRDDIIADMPCLAAVIEAGQQTTSSEDSQDVQQKTNE